MSDHAIAPDRQWLVVANGGTTNLRLHLVDRLTSEVTATQHRALGVADVARGAQRQVLWSALSDGLMHLEAKAGTRLSQLAALGMLTSEVGLVEVPHVEAPAGLPELARHARPIESPEVGGRCVLMIPGVRTPPGEGDADWTDCDMMRGEECETFGAWHLLGRPTPPLMFLWPGSHTKLVALASQGQIARSYTTLAGELLEAIAKHTLVSASLPKEFPAEPELTALAKAEELLETHGLGRLAFLVRLSQVLGRADPSWRAAFWTAAVATDDAWHLARQAMLRAEVPIWVGGRQPLRSLYALALQRRLQQPVLALTQVQADAAAAVGASLVHDLWENPADQKPPVTPP
jgi:2-dehydro-3-deoxygalactonokinase